MAFSKFIQHTASSASTASSGIWLCPHESLDFEEAQKLALYLPPDTEGHYVERLRVCPCRDINNWVSQSIESKSTSLLTRIPVWEIESVRETVFVRDTETLIRNFFRPERIEQLLCSLNVPICMHLRTNDWQVATCYREHNSYTRFDDAGTPWYCHNNRRSELSPDFPHMASCLKCYGAGTHTLFGFQTIHSVLDDVEILYLEFWIIRDLNGLAELRSPAWRMHSTTPSIPPEVRPYFWRCWLAEQDRKTQMWLDTANSNNNIEACRAEPDPLRAELNVVRAKLDTILEARHDQKPHVRFINFFKKKSKSSRQIQSKQQPSTAKMEQISRDEHMKPANLRNQMPIAECQIDRCCITWNAANRLFDPAHRSG